MVCTYSAAHSTKARMSSRTRMPLAVTGLSEHENSAAVAAPAGMPATSRASAARSEFLNLITSS